jgi:hypothetical protein
VTPPAERISRVKSASSADSTAWIVAARFRSNSVSSSATDRCARFATCRSLYESLPPRMVRVGGSPGTLEPADPSALRAMSIRRGYVHSMDAMCARIWRPFQPPS